MYHQFKILKTACQQVHIWILCFQILQTIKPFKAPPKVNRDWKRKVALTMINNLDESKLAKSICSQVSQIRTEGKVVSKQRVNN